MLHIEQLFFKRHFIDSSTEETDNHASPRLHPLKRTCVRLELPVCLW